MLTSSDLVARRLTRALLLAGLALACGGLFWMVTAVFDRVHNTLVIVVFSILFAYFVYPPIKWLAVRRVPIALAGLIVYAGLAVIVLGAGAWLAPAVAGEAQALSRDYPHIVGSVERQIADPRHSPFLQRFPAGARDAIAMNAGKAGLLVGGFAGVVGTQALAFIQGTTAALIDLVLVLGLTLLIVGDLANIQDFGVRLVPRAYRPTMMSFMNDVDSVVGGFVRGQVLLAVGVAIAGTIVLMAVGVPYGLLLGLLAGIASIVPMVGPIVAIVPVLVIAFFTVGLVKAIVVLALYVLIIMLQQNVLVPAVARSVGVTPLVIFVALLLGGEAFGILGALLALPIAGILRVLALRVFPLDLQADAQLRAARDLAGEPRDVTKRATGGSA